MTQDTATFPVYQNAPQDALTAPALTDAQKLAQEYGATITHLSNGSLRFTRPADESDEGYDFVSKTVKKAKMSAVNRYSRLMGSEKSTDAEKNQATWTLAQAMVVDQSVVLEDVLSVEDSEFYLPAVLNGGKIETPEDETPLAPTEG